MRNRIGTGLAGDLDQALGDQGTRDRGPEQVLALVDRIGAKHRENVVTRKLLAQILDVDLLDARRHGLGPRRLHLFTLTDIGGERHDLAAILVLEPFQNDGGVQPAGVGQNDFVDARMSHVAPL